MTPQEQQLLVSLTQRVNQTQLQEKDPDAENLLGRELGANPDAVYILAQTVLVQDIALQQARAQVTQLQQQLQQARQQPAHTTSFLGRLLGEHDSPQIAPPAAPPVPPMQQAPYAGGSQPPYQPVPGYQAPPPPQYAQPQFMAVPAGQPSFLRSAMQTATGVAAGALAFEGVEAILHGFGHGGYGPGFGTAGFGMGPGIGMGGGFERPVDETVVNNYYGAGERPDATGASDPRFDAGGNEPHFHESNDTLGNQGAQDQGGAQFVDAGYNTGADPAGGAYDQGNFDTGTGDGGAVQDTGAEDAPMDDSGSGLDDGSGGGFDDGGGFDSGSGDGF